MHLAVDHNAYQILAYMLIELQLDVNKLTAKKDDAFHTDAKDDN